MFGIQMLQSEDPPSLKGSHGSGDESADADKKVKKKKKKK